MEKVKKIIDILFFVGLILIPFTQISGIELLREYAHESAIYCWLLGGTLVLIDDIWVKKRIEFPLKSKIILFWSAFFVWCLLSYMFNFTEIQSNYFKFRTGNNRFVFQIISLFLPSYFLVYYFTNVFKRRGIKNSFMQIRKVLLCTFYFVFAYAVVELWGGKLDSAFARSIIEAFNLLPVLNKTEYYGSRLSSVSFEVPALGNYLIFIYGWMFSYVFTASIWYKKFLPSILVIALTLLSGARAALVIVLFQVILGWILYVKVTEIKINNKILFSALITLFVVGIMNRDTVNSVLEEKMNFFDVEHSISNKTRYGMQYSSLMVFKENPVVGVGFGQNGFHKQNHYPEWAVRDNYEFTDWYLNDEVYNFAPDFNLYTRLLAETGIIGLVLFLVFLGVVLKESYLLLSMSNEIKVLGIVLLLSFVGLIINWLQIDFFRQFGFWICLSLLVVLVNGKEIRI